MIDSSIPILIEFEIIVYIIMLDVVACVQIMMKWFILVKLYSIRKRDILMFFRKQLVFDNI